MVRVEFSQFKELAKHFNQLSKKDIDAFGEAAVKNLAARLLAKVKERTPVGVPPERPVKEQRKIKVRGISGKSKTFLSRNEALWQKYWGGYVGGTLRNAWTVGKVTKEGNTYKVEVFNPMYYASYVEKGHRQTPGRYVPAIGRQLKKGWVTGLFMLKISEEELNADAHRIVSERLDKFLNKALGGR